ncbi:titin-like isoform X3 [Gymnodraco acuticeps]|uniref:Titin-like isoform X3 n=1 Tax=Gymnodraco acuticeps TaxID=8218 RepID=A0A6P8W2I7_GYMAC|nr:titin-like isoform X3 [Gymnodraco acuticeps]
MILTASGFFVFLLCMPAVQGQNGWGATYSSTQICAVKGSTVEISCSYKYPSTINHQVNTVQKTFWFTQKKDGELVDLTTASEYSGRVEDLCENNRCTLRIKNLTESDSAEYRFRLKTNKDAYTASPGVTLSVTDPDLLVIGKTIVHQSNSKAELQCHSRCLLPHDPSYIWYKNGQNIRGETFSHSVYFHSADSFSCALKGHENFPSPSQCVDGQTCNRVIHTDRSICAFKGSSVDISCIYSSYESITDGFWFSPERYHQGQNSSQPEDLSEDSQYRGRVQILETERGRSTLRISDLRDSDSAQYLFKFKTPSFEWRSDLPGTTLTVTDPDLKVKVKVQVHSYSWSELQCYTSCRLPHGSSYIWYENGLKMAKKTLSSYSVYFGFASSYSCAVRGHEDFPSPPVCVTGQTCNRVIYTERSICALNGSSVDISCTYNGYKVSVKSKFWFSPERSHQGQNPSQPEDLSKDSQYRGRVQILETWRGHSTLRISDLRDSDSAQYLFTFKTTSFEWGSDLPGTTLTVTALQVQVITSTVHQAYTYAELKCRSSCSPAGVSYVWFKNNKKIIKEERPLYKDQFYPGDIISCALQGHENYSSPLIYALKFPVVSVSPSDEIMEGSSVTLTCSSDANPAANYTWYKTDGNQKLHPLAKERQLVFSSILVSDSGEYNCTAENELGKRTSDMISVDVKYSPKPPSVSASPSAEIEEGSSVTLTCSSDANPAADYTWYKENQTLFQGAEGSYHVTSISSEDSGIYYCKSRNQFGEINSTSLFVDVLYAPKPPSVSVSPSAEIEEGSSVTLTCSSDANPAANYTWYKEDEDSPKASGQIFTITDFRAEHSGSYSCGAKNKIGRQNSTFHQIVVTGAWTSRAAGITTAVVLAVILLSIFLLIRKKKSAKRSSEPGEPHSKQSPPEELLYASVQFSKNQSDPLSSNIEDSVVYAEVQFNSAAPRSQMSATEDSTALYSTINKTRTQHESAAHHFY